MALRTRMSPVQLLVSTPRMSKSGAGGGEYQEPNFLRGKFQAGRWGTNQIAILCGGDMPASLATSNIISCPTV